MKHEVCPKCYMTIEEPMQKCMCLPDGKTCEDCISFKRCKSLGVIRGDGRSCDWWPIRFISKTVTENKIKIRMLQNVRPDLIFLAKPGTILRQNLEYDAMTNQNGAISGLCANGEYMGVKPGEFEFVSAPEWVLAIHKNCELRP